MIQWIRAKLYHGHGDDRCTAHLFECGKESLMIKKFRKGHYPPFDALELTNEDAIKLRDWLIKIIPIECVHESDGNIYWDNERFPEKSKCKKCGEFYR